jgi:hypothetical protein
MSSLIDNFHKQCNIHFVIEFSTSFPFPKIVDGVEIKRKGFWQYELQFSHSNYDLVGLLTELEFLKKDYYSDTQKKCIFPDIFGVFFWNHFHTLWSKPALHYCRSLPIYFDTKVIPKHNLYIIYESIYKPLSVQFSTFLCALQIMTYFEITGKSYCKLQIMTYLPWVEGKNKIFSDVQIISFSNSLQNIIIELQSKRISVERLYEIYQKYHFLSNLLSFPSQQIPSFDLCFSNLPFPLLFYNVKITKKTLQFENVYVQVLCNQNNNLYFCSSGIYPKFLETLENLIPNLSSKEEAQK